MGTGAPGTVADSLSFPPAAEYRFSARALESANSNEVRVGEWTRIGVHRRAPARMCEQFASTREVSSFCNLRLPVSENRIDHPLQRVALAAPLGGP